MDFSASQKGAYAEEYVDLCVSLILGFSQLSGDAQKAERSDLHKQALEAQCGCEMHFWWLATHLWSNSGLVPAEEANTFECLLCSLLSVNTSPTEFQESVTSLSSTFP